MSTLPIGTNLATANKIYDTAVRLDALTKVRPHPHFKHCIVGQ